MRPHSAIFLLEVTILRSCQLELIVSETTNETKSQQLTKSNVFGVEMKSTRDSLLLNISGSVLSKFFNAEQPDKTEQESIFITDTHPCSTDQLK